MDAFASNDDKEEYFYIIRSINNMPLVCLWERMQDARRLRAELSPDGYENPLKSQTIEAWEIKKKI